VTGIKLPRASKAHKPADSGVVVGNGARCCGFQEVTLNAVKHALRFETAIAGKPAPTVCVVLTHFVITSNPVGAGLPAMNDNAIPLPSTQPNLASTNNRMASTQTSPTTTPA